MRNQHAIEIEMGRTQTFMEEAAKEKDYTMAAYWEAKLATLIWILEK